MKRVDWLVTNRLASSIAIVVLVFFGIIALTESLDAYRFEFLSEAQGQYFAILAIVASAARWSIKVLPVTVLIGAIIALLDLQGNRELMVIKASGISIWRIVRGPVVFIIFSSVAISLVFDSWVTELNRSIVSVPRSGDTNIGGADQIWLKQESTSGNFVVQATRAARGTNTVSVATFFMPPGLEVSRIEAATAELTFGEWVLEDVTLITSNNLPQKVATYRVPTSSTPADLELRLAATDDFTFFELSQALASGIADPVVQAAAAMRFAKLLALPALLVGSLLIAFAFTAGYRRTGSYGQAIISGIVLGFVVFVITEMADRAGSAGVLDPAFAAWGPAIVAIITGVSVLLHKEDGRA